MLSTDTEFDFNKQGRALFKPSPRLSDQVQRIRANLHAAEFAQGLKVREMDSNRPVVKASIDRNAFHALMARDDIRAIRPIGYTDPRAANWPEDVLDKAREQGEVSVTIILRNGGYASANIDQLSAKAIDAQSKAYQRAFSDIGQLRFGQVVDVFIEILANAANGTGVSLYRLGLKPFELEVFKMGLIVLLEMGFGRWCH